ncbi:chromate transporter [Salisediminibacterium halotolerans]|uniref:Chromate transporter n=1 Tax=Salisediminibacterium halotolerans TaxID=517425 RepID=A0A1H9WQE5_9BACI|nr:MULTISPECIES: chromate transporter [Salisediminibacterium]RLJ69232.1 chromate transporter [Actinophytocola xinjiangensis]RPE87033.1 chromate transporter [Salisediminibacterium halotolerans]TWG32234.1 chromate transporter [Salisediminibacterium halotolerans]SES36166.1 chromate transporter [Salisediminibacterium haloalkalitolerans]GEL08773.1 putative transporter YwrA [Salisediminibacterium halotolerans]
MNHRDMFYAFFRVGMLGFGGGPAAIPIVEKEIVEKYKQMEQKEFGDMLAIANTLPGPIATKLAGYIGYRLLGTAGMINALIASVFPTVLLMILLLVTLSSFRDYAWVEGMTRGVMPVVTVLLGVLTWGFFAKSKQDLGWLYALILLGGSVLVIQGFGLHPAVLIAALILFVFMKRERPKAGEAG